MATIYEIDSAILDCIDVETGEIIDEEKLAALQMERDKKIEAVAKWIINLESDAAGYKERKDLFAEREKAAKAKIESLKNWLTYATNGQKFQTLDVKINFRKSESVVIDDEETFIELAQATGRDDLLTFKAPSPNKTAIKAALKSGDAVFGAALIEKQNIQIK